MDSYDKWRRHPFASGLLPKLPVVVRNQVAGAGKGIAIFHVPGTVACYFWLTSEQTLKPLHAFQNVVVPGVSAADVDAHHGGSVLPVGGRPSKVVHHDLEAHTRQTGGWVLDESTQARNHPQLVVADMTQMNSPASQTLEEFLRPAASALNAETAVQKANSPKSLRWDARTWTVVAALAELLVVGLVVDAVVQRQVHFEDVANPWKEERMPHQN